MCFLAKIIFREKPLIREARTGSRLLLILVVVGRPFGLAVAWGLTVGGNEAGSLANNGKIMNKNAEKIE